MTEMPEPQALEPQANPAAAAASPPRGAVGLIVVYISRAIDGLSGGNVSTAQAYVSDVTTHENRAKAMGMLGAAFGIGFSIGPGIGGLLGGIHVALPALAAATCSFIA